MNKAKAKQNQGEGNREAARRFNEKEQEFTRSKEGRRAIEEGTHLDEEEAKQAERKEREGRDKAREKDPQVVRDYRSGDY